jgi:hypothetical protein
VDRDALARYLAAVPESGRRAALLQFLMPAADFMAAREELFAAITEAVGGPEAMARLGLADHAGVLALAPSASETPELRRLREAVEPPDGRNRAAAHERDI